VPLVFDELIERDTGHRRARLEFLSRTVPIHTEREDGGSCARGGEQLDA
jgi:hypothetical protein